MTNSPENILEDYLAEVESKISGEPFSSRKDFIAEIRSHLVEEWENTGEKTTANLLNILERFGDADEIVADYRGRSSGQAKKEAAVTYPPVWLVLVLTVILWPVGIILAWLSPAWRTVDKIVATIIPLFAFAFIFLLLIAVPGGYHEESVEQEIIREEIYQKKIEEERRHNDEF